MDALYPKGFAAYSDRQLYVAIHGCKTMNRFSLLIALGLVLVFGHNTLAQDNDTYNAILQQWIAAQNSGRFEEALRAARQLLAIDLARDPEWVGISRYRVGMVLALMGRQDEAEAE